MRPQAIFSKPRPKVEPVEVEKPAKKPSLWPFGGQKASKTSVDEKNQSKTTKLDKAAEYKRRQGFGGVVSAFDFAETRSKSDAALLYEAKYGKLEGGKMTREQYMALRRKIGGTAKDYWKDWVEVKGQYVDKGYVSDEETTVPGLPFLLGVVLALLGTLGYVVAQTQ
jgi:hypothetical protein